MANNISRKAFFEKNGFKMTNPYWSWSGVNNEKKLVMFNVWKHYKEKHDKKIRYLVLHDLWKESSKLALGFNDSEKI